MRSARWPCLPGRHVDSLEQNAAAANRVLTLPRIIELDTVLGPQKVAGARYAEAAMAGIE